jgi:hypothetical protein
MDTRMPYPRKSGAGLFLVTLVLALLSVVAFRSSLALSYEEWRPQSGLWFVYEVSRYFAYLGIAISAGMIATVAVRHTISKKSLVLMEFSVCSTVLLLWCAAHIFRSPW